MAAGDLTLLASATSQFSDRTKIALNLKSLNYELIVEDVFRKSELLLKSNPVYEKVPVLIHGDRILCESMIIVEYIDEVRKNGPSIVPSDPHERAISRFWTTFIDNQVLIESDAVLRLEMAEGPEAQLTAKDRLVEATLLLEDVFQKLSKGRDFFGGDHIGYLDVALGGFLGWLRTAERLTRLKVLDVAVTPGLARWAEKLWAHDAVKNVPPKPEVLDNMAEKIRVVLGRNKHYHH